MTKNDLEIYIYFFQYDVYILQTFLLLFVTVVNDC